MRRLSVLCALCAILMAADCQTSQSCTHIVPESPLVELNTFLTVFCILNQRCLQEWDNDLTAQDIYWKVGEEMIPQSHYTVVNDSVSSVTFQPTLSMRDTLTCSFNKFGQTPITLHGTFFRLGYPPEKPENLTCICYNMETLTCTWEPGRATIIPTKYTLRQYWVGPDLVSNTENLTPTAYPHKSRPFLSRSYEEKEDCKAQKGNNFCTLRYPNFMAYINTAFMVEAKNELGQAQSDRLEFSDIINIVKPNPPKIVSVSAITNNVLKLDWENPLKSMVPLRYNIRYRPVNSSEWSEVPSDDLERTRTFMLKGLESYTVYVFIIRCKLHPSLYWSDWSEEHTGITSESTPSQAPEFWRKISKMDDEKWLVQLMWKDLKSHANGIILGYNVTLKKGTEVIEDLVVKDTAWNITVPKGSYDVVLTAYNSQGSSPSSNLKISPRADEKEVQPGDMKVNAFPKDGKLWVEWTPQKGVLGYVIEWCSNSESMDCDVEWQREPKTAVKTFLRGDIKPFLYYLIRVHPLYKDRKERSSSIGMYLEQGVPDIGPSVNVKTMGKTWVTLILKPVPLLKSNGFITNYTITYKGNDKSAEDVTVNASVTEFTLKSLAAKTTYTVSVTANTEKGGMAGIPLSLITPPYGCTPLSSCQRLCEETTTTILLSTLLWLMS